MDGEIVKVLGLSGVRKDLDKVEGRPGAHLQQPRTEGLEKLLGLEFGT